MSKISLKHSGGNVVSLNSPTSAPTSADVAFKLPNADGTNGQVLKTDGSGNLSFGADSGGKFASYAIIADVKASNADGGTFTTGDWRTRDLNTELADADGIVSISSNQFTLQAGSYLIIFSAQAHEPNSHQTRLYNVTTSANVQVGQSMYGGASHGVTTASRGVARVTISGSTVFEIQHRCASTKTTFGLGVGTSGNMNWGGSAATDGAIYCTVEIYKEA
jgi:hypothetical protein